MRKKQRHKNKINQLLKEKGITKRDLALKIEMDETQIGHLAAGQDCLLSTAKRIAIGLGEKLDTIWPTL